MKIALFPWKIFRNRPDAILNLSAWSDSGFLKKIKPLEPWKLEVEKTLGSL